ncbi:Prolycopene isomerase [Vigna angularis]|uniref:Prolycopene isomerase n=1 Tax=Phaseolus angularis TaxID=3914 RepID=A0A8T0KUY9_PHAAN|nr:Prolycopene isomerase [Vigna angularis]
MTTSPFLSLCRHPFSHTSHRFPTGAASQSSNFLPKFQSFASGNHAGSEFPSGFCSNALRRKRVSVVCSKSTLNVEEVAERGVKGKGEEFDAIVIGSGIGGLVAGTQLAVKGARVLVLEKYVIPGGSSGFYQRDGYTFDVGSSVMFGFSDKVLCDRHFGGINYPLGGVGGIAKSLAKGLVDQGSEIVYKANVTGIIIEQGKAVGVRLADGREFFAKTIISNATRWDTFGKLLKGVPLPKEEENFQKVYVKAPSFLSIHMGVKAEILPPDTDCHHFVLESNWSELEDSYGSIFLSIPTVLDSSLAPEGRHILHIFTTSSMGDWEGLSRVEYEAKKQLVADEIISRLENKLFPGLRSSIDFIEVGTPKTHRRYLARDKGTYGPMPRGTPKGLLGMPFNTTGIAGLYCVGDSCFPGQGVIAVAFSGVMCAHRVAADIDSVKEYYCVVPQNGSNSKHLAGEKVTCVGFHAASVAWLDKNNGMRFNTWQLLFDHTIVSLQISSSMFKTQQFATEDRWCQLQLNPWSAIAWEKNNLEGAK